ncbi:hypothetical protein EAG_11732 [Camponotus floridanus]|uniref:Uncharacterized protein n=2 Tax=Camponotus floridanus TaxID=104421 RepID=E2AYG1_CAMFO|nr:hypothetical protein EAG_11732 [Camponotus floridanus]
MNTDLQKKRELRDKVKSLQQELTRVFTTNKSLSEERIKRKELEKQLINCESEKIILQNQLLDMQTSVCKCASSKISVEKQDSLKVQDCPKVKFNEIINKSEVDALKLKKNDSCIIIEDSIEMTPLNIKSQGFFSMKDHGIKRERSNTNLKVPSILAKKSKFNAPSQKTNSGNDMTFDGFGGHAKYDKYPNPISSSHIKKMKKK